MEVWSLYVDNGDGDIGYGLFSTEKKAKAAKEKLIVEEMKQLPLGREWMEAHYRIRIEEVE